MEYINKADLLKNKNLSLEELVLDIREYLISHFENLGKSYSANSILESRFTPPDIAFNIGMSSCGSKTNIATEMLRHLGYQVKKVHGSIPESSDHAWIEVYNKSQNIWKSFDITKSDCKTTSNHIVIAKCNEWIEISKEIQSALK